MPGREEGEAVGNKVVDCGELERGLEETGNVFLEIAMVECGEDGKLYETLS